MAFLNTFRLTLLASLAFAYYLFSSSAFRGGAGMFQRSKRAPTSPNPAWNSYPDRCTTPNTLSFTFDEGPSESTSLILDAFKARDLTATFHVESSLLYVTSYANILRRAYADNHLIGIRLNTSIADPTALTIPELETSLLASAEAVHAQIGVYPKYVRLPYAKTSAEINEMLSKNGFVATGYAVDSLDYQVTSAAVPNAIGTYVVSQVSPALSNPVVVFRDVHPITGQTMAATLDVVFGTGGTPPATPSGGAATTSAAPALEKRQATAYTHVPLDVCLGLPATDRYRADNKPKSGSATTRTATTTAKGGSSTTAKPTASTTNTPGQKGAAMTNMGGLDVSVKVLVGVLVLVAAVL
ncbi:hypothetical protein BC832DRAFT_623746 [Gaertneriomyces semiglobifer]|nr:hypothetical protein BC832DRAFT_623746 [Gaertneriomyces semiglobifer]